MIILGSVQHLPPGSPPLKPHPFANLFPMMTDAEYQAHSADIRAHGINRPIVLHRGAILDGRNRYRAALEVGIGVPTQVFAGTDREALDLVCSENIHRRHLTTEQRALIAARMAEIRLGGNQHTVGKPASIEAPSLPLVAPARAAKRERTSWPPGHVVGMTREYPGDGNEPMSVGTCECGSVWRFPVADKHVQLDAAIEAHWASFETAAAGPPQDEAAGAAPHGEGREAASRTIEPPKPLVSQADAAAIMNVSRSSVQRAAIVIEKGVPELADAIAEGKIAASTAAAIAELPFERQREIIAAADPKAVKAVAKEQRSAKREASREKKLDKMRAINDAAPLLNGKVYAVIYADPPWRFEVYSRDTGMEKSADNHYPTMGLDEIKALDVAGLAAPDCALFLWATAPMLPQALEVMAAWGFAYKSHVIWDKGKSGTGFWFRNRHEILLLGTRGEIPAPGSAPYPSIIADPAGGHSVKPLAFINMIEHMFPGVPSIELFSRKPRQGWDAWGNQAGDTPPSLDAIAAEDREIEAAEAAE